MSDQVDSILFALVVLKCEFLDTWFSVPNKQA